MDVKKAMLEAPVSLPEELSGRQQAAALALVRCVTFAGAARMSGVSERSLSRWMREEKFAQAVRTMRCEIAESTFNTLARLRSRAVTVLVETLNDKRHPGARASAARTLRTLNQDTDLRLARLERLERLLEKLVRALADGTPPAALTALLTTAQEQVEETIRP